MLDGTEVVVKVQYPGVEGLFRGDFKMTRRFCEMAQPEHLPFVDETERQFLTEFDYVLEAANLREIGRNLNGNPLWKDRVVVPAPFPALCSKRVLTMEYLDGTKLIAALMHNAALLAAEREMDIDSFLEHQKRLNVHPTASEMADIHRKLAIRDAVWNAMAFWVNLSFGVWLSFLGHSTPTIVARKESVKPLNIKLMLNEVASVHSHELFIDGAFNGDPHPGNVLLLSDGRIGLIDYGQVHIPSFSLSL